MTQHSAVAVAPACLRLLGGWQLIVDGAEIELGHREQRLTALLGVAGPGARAQAASALWPDSTDEHALGSLRRAVRQCRTRCPDVLVADRLTIGLAPVVRVDVDDLRRVAGLTRLPMSDEVAHELHRALRGPELLPGWFDDWVVEERARLDQLRVEALERIAQHGLDEGDFALAVAAADDAGAIDPLRESARELSIRGHLGKGDVGSALHELQRYSTVLGEELGVAPPARIRELVEPLREEPAAPRAQAVAARRPTTAPEEPVSPAVVPEDAVPWAPSMGLDEWLAGRPAHGVRRVVAALVGVAGLTLAVVLAVATAGPDPQPAATTDPGEGSPVGPLVAPEGPGPADSRQPVRSVRVRLVDSASGAAAFAVRATPVPAEVTLVVRGPAGLRVVRRVVVRDPSGRRVVVDGLDAGTYQWSATSADAGQVGGEVLVTPAPVEDVRGAERGGSATVSPAVETPTATPTSGATPTPTPTPTATSTPNPPPRPSPSPSPTGTPKDPGAVAPTPVG